MNNAFFRAPTGRPENLFGLVNDLSGDKRAGMEHGRPIAAEKVEFPGKAAFCL
jgi:hypothetical protein